MLVGHSVVDLSIAIAKWVGLRKVVGSRGMPGSPPTFVPSFLAIASTLNRAVALSIGLEKVNDSSNPATPNCREGLISVPLVLLAHLLDLAVPVVVARGKRQCMPGRLLEAALAPIDTSNRPGQRTGADDCQRAEVNTEMLRVAGQGQVNALRTNATANAVFMTRTGKVTVCIAGSEQEIRKLPAADRLDSYTIG